jgi:hypothetical protein
MTTALAADYLFQPPCPARRPLTSSRSSSGYSPLKTAASWLEHEANDGLGPQRPIAPPNYRP